VKFHFLLTETPIGPIHEEKILGNIPNKTNCLVLVLFFKVGIPVLTVFVRPFLLPGPYLEPFLLILCKGRNPPIQF